ncbi:MAG: HD domain-containing protein [Actinobacteria bacterium]|nr:HD domain-containing protein [Actinomycetota bacterium]
MSSKIAYEPHVLLTEKYSEAVLFASTLHRRQTRKGNDIAYVAHLLGVSSLVLEARGDEDQAIAALLHDAAEDQGGQPTIDVIEGKFGSRVSGIVKACSDSLAENPGEKASWLVRKTEHIAKLAVAADDVVIVAMADKVHNARAIVSDLSIHGTKTWTKFNASSEQILWYYTSNLLVAQERKAPRFLIDALDRALGEMRGFSESQ